MDGGVTANLTKARRWYRAAADQDNARAQYELGKLAADCQGFSADNPELVRLLHRSAEQGFRDAQEILGYMYSNGIGGVPTTTLKPTCGTTSRRRKVARTTLRSAI